MIIAFNVFFPWHNGSPISYSSYGRIVADSGLILALIGPNFGLDLSLLWTVFPESVIDQPPWQHWRVYQLTMVASHLTTLSGNTPLCLICTRLAPATHPLLTPILSFTPSLPLYPSLYICDITVVQAGISCHWTLQPLRKHLKYDPNQIEVSSVADTKKQKTDVL